MSIVSSRFFVFFIFFFFFSSSSSCTTPLSLGWIKWRIEGIDIRVGG